jgi:hypothetical protein
MLTICAVRAPIVKVTPLHHGIRTLTAQKDPDSPMGSTKTMTSGNGVPINRESNQQSVRNSNLIYITIYTQIKMCTA